METVKFPQNGSYTPLQKISAHIKVEEFQDLMERTREYTASSLSGLHMVHYKAGEASESIMKIIVAMINIPFENVHTVPRWNKSIHMMKEKIPGNHSSQKMRIIQLVEEDFNTYQKIKIG